VSSKPKDLRGKIMAPKSKEPDRIRQYMTSLEANLEKATGKSLAQWVKIARSCPHSKPRERLDWFKKQHGLGISRATLVLWKAYGVGSLGSNDPDALVDRLFSRSFEGQRDTYELVVKFVARLGAGTVSPRKGFVALYRLKQYATLKPRKKGLLLGLALKKYPKVAGLEDLKARDGDRIRKGLYLRGKKDFGAEAKALLKAAYAEA
jgi:hypothetical protein